MLQIRAISPDGLDLASELLAKGFPSRSLAFWKSGLRRLAGYNRSVGSPSIGKFLIADEKPVGVLLTIASRDLETGRAIINLSSWYIEERHRWFGPRMLLAAMSDKAATYTDLTPSKNAIELNDRLGFRSIHYKLLLFFLPWLALAGKRQGQLVPLDKVPPGALSDSWMDALTSHQQLGCIVTTVKTEGRYHPVVLDMIRKKNIPIARVIFAESSAIVSNNLAPISRLLLTRGIPLLCLQAREDETVSHAKTWKRLLRYQVKGEWDDRSINELYSERVLLKV